MKKCLAGFWPALMVAGVFSLIWVGAGLNAAPSVDHSSNGRQRLVDYIVVTNADWDAFQTTVNARFSEGYGPVGGIAINSDGHPLQAMAR